MRSLKPFLFLLGTLLLADACAPDQLTPTLPVTDAAAHARKAGKPMSQQEIETYIEQGIAKKTGGGMTRPLYDWDWATEYQTRRICGSNCEDDLLDYLQVVWSTTKYAGPTITVGYQIPGYDFKDLTKINLNEKAWQEARQQVLNTAFEIEKQFNKELKTPEDLVVYGEEVLPNFDIQLTQFETFEKLSNSGLIRYFIPSDFQHSGALFPQQNQGNNAKGRAGFNINDMRLGCGSNEGPGGPFYPQTDYTLTTPNNSKISWNLLIHKMNDAWNRGATGHGQYIAYFDTGLSDTQNRMNGEFWGGLSGSRLMDRQVSLPSDSDGPIETHHDPCGHGTCSASIGTAPRMGTSPIGVAYEASLVSVRASADVVFTNAREFRGVHNAFVRMANTPNVRVISMSMGTVPYIPRWVPGLGQLFNFGYQHVTDAIRLAHQQGKLIFSAAGTFDPDDIPGRVRALLRVAGINDIRNMVVFPANLPEVVAVTGVKARQQANGMPLPIEQYNTTLETCQECFYGNKVDFAVINQKNNWGNANRVLALPRAWGNEPTTFGGSSSATATMSAMAIALWSKYPNFTRQQILDRLRQNASHGTNRQGNVGYGVVNMGTATL